MAEKTPAQKEAQRRYMGKFAIARVRMESADLEAVKAHAASRGESLNEFLERAITETMEREESAAALKGVFKLNESRLRAKLKKAGYALRKSRSRTINIDNQGEFMVVDISMNAAVFGGRYDASLEEVIEWAKEAGIIEQ